MITGLTPRPGEAGHRLAGHSPRLDLGKGVSPADTNEVMHPSEKLHDVARWRCEQLARAGFPLPLARRLSRERGTDLHALIKLVERGCPPYLALRILAPSDGNGEAA